MMDFARTRLVPPMLLFLVLIASPGRSQAALLGMDFQVNTYTTGGQTAPSVSAGASSDFVVVWSSDGSGSTDSDLSSIQAQKVSADGSPIGVQFQVNSYTSSVQISPAVAVGGNGDFVVVWGSYGSGLGDDQYFSIIGQRYYSDLSLAGEPFLVNSTVANGSYKPSVAIDSSDDFVVVWHNDIPQSVFAQRYESNGSRRGSEFQVNTGDIAMNASVDTFANGDFVVAWQSYGSDGSVWGILSQRFSSGGTALGMEFQVNSFTSGYQQNGSVATLENGQFVLAWQSDGSSGLDNSLTSIQGRLFASDGTAVGSDFQVNTYGTNEQNYPTVSGTGDGSFVVAWASNGSAGRASFGWSIQGQRFASDGSALGSQFEVNTTLGGSQKYPSLTSLGSGEFVVAWQGTGSTGSDSDGYSIQGRRYGATVTVTGTVWHDLDGDGQRQPMEPALIGWTVELRDSTGALIEDVAVTDTSGDYSIPSIHLGDHTLRLQPRDPWRSTDPYDDSVDQRLWILDRQLGFFFSGSYFFDGQGCNEKSFQGAGGDWYMILPNGQLFLWDSNLGCTGTLVANLDVAHYDDPSGIHDALPPVVEPLALMAWELDQHHDLLMDSGGYFENLMGCGEKWLRSGPAGWYLILPTGEVLQWDGQTGCGGRQADALDAGYHNEPVRLHEAPGPAADPAAQWAWELDQDLGLFMDGSYFYNASGCNEKWVRGASLSWFLILPPGHVIAWDGNPVSCTGTLLAVLDAGYHADPSLLHEATSQGTDIHRLPIEPFMAFNGFDFGVTSLLFSDGFESGALNAWSSAVP